jgi:hypothetical protein
VTEYEYADLIATYSANVGSFMAIYLTLISGYLITAFVAGPRLNRAQVFILSFGLIVASFVSTWGTFGAGMTQVHYTNKLIALAADSPQLNRVWVMWIVATLMIGGTLASLFFMWNVRRRAAQ